jgi:hypothetical protein
MPDPSQDVTRYQVIPFAAGEWTLEFTAYDENNHSATAEVHFTVQPSATADLGPVSIVDVNPKQGYSPVLVNAAQYTEGDEMTISGRNLEENSGLTV